jgi:hypothetical protein
MRGTLAKRIRKFFFDHRTSIDAYPITRYGATVLSARGRRAYQMCKQGITRRTLKFKAGEVVEVKK